MSEPWWKFWTPSSGFFGGLLNLVVGGFLAWPLWKWLGGEYALWWAGAIPVLVVIEVWVWNPCRGR